MVCTTCGIEIPENQKVCRSCGQRVVRSNSYATYPSEATVDPNINVWGTAVRRTLQDGCSLFAFIFVVVISISLCAGLILLFS